MAGPVLVADPDTLSRKQITARLQSGYFVPLTLDCIDTPSLLARALHADLVLLPATADGRAALLALRQTELGWALPIVGYAIGPIPDQKQLSWFQSGGDDIVPFALEGDLLLARLEGLIRYKRGNDRLQLAVGGFCEAKAPRHALRPPANWSAMPVIDFDPAAPDTQGESPLPFADLITNADVLLERLQTIPDAMVRLRLRDPEAGLQLIPQIRADAARQYLPLLVQVDPGQDHIARKAVDLGASDVVVGEAPPDLLRARLVACDRRRFMAADLQTSILDQLRLTMVDPLSGLYNRRYVDRYGPAALARSTDNTQPFALIMIDIDRFKGINDLHGHACGDRVISVVSRRISRAIRAEDMAARIGGEEFLVILPCTGPEDAEAIANRVRDAISRSSIRLGIPGQMVDVTVSVGVSVVQPTTKASFSDTMSMADRALYRSKTTGRDRISMQRCGAAA